MSLVRERERAGGKDKLLGINHQVMGQSGVKGDCHGVETS